MIEVPNIECKSCNRCPLNQIITSGQATNKIERLMRENLSSPRAIGNRGFYVEAYNLSDFKQWYDEKINLLSLFKEAVNNCDGSSSEAPIIVPNPAYEMHQNRNRFTKWVIDKFFQLEQPTPNLILPNELERCQNKYAEQVLQTPLVS